VEYDTLYCIFTNTLTVCHVAILSSLSLSLSLWAAKQVVFKNKLGNMSFSPRQSIRSSKEGVAWVITTNNHSLPAAHYRWDLNAILVGWLLLLSKWKLIVKQLQISIPTSTAYTISAIILQRQLLWQLDWQLALQNSVSKCPRCSWSRRRKDVNIDDGSSTNQVTKEVNND